MLILPGPLLTPMADDKFPAKETTFKTNFNDFNEELKRHVNGVGRIETCIPECGSALLIQSELQFLCAKEDEK